VCPVQQLCEQRLQQSMSFLFLNTSSTLQHSVGAEHMRGVPHMACSNMFACTACRMTGPGRACEASSTAGTASMGPVFAVHVCRHIAYRHIQLYEC
jgi:hypothetical protein